MSTALPGNQWQVLMCVFRKTYGWHKKSDYITNSQIIEATRLGKSVVSRSLQLLEAANIITRSGRVVGFQKDWEKWQPELAKRLTKVSQVDNKNTGEKLATCQPELATCQPELAKRLTKVSQPLVTQKKKETIQKKLIQKKDIVLPEWINKETWDAFIEMRKSKKEPLTNYGAKLIINALERLKISGNDPTEVLNQSIMNNWKGVFALKENKNAVNSKDIKQHYSTQFSTNYEDPETYFKKQGAANV